MEKYSGELQIVYVGTKRNKIFLLQVKKKLENQNIVLFDILVFSGYNEIQKFSKAPIKYKNDIKHLSSCILVLECLCSEIKKNFNEFI